MMDLVWYSRYRRGGKDRFVDWEFSGGIDNWDDAPAPAQVAKRVTEGFQKEVPVDKAPMMNNAVHWGYGMLLGALYGITAGSLRKASPVYGLILGPIVWSGPTWSSRSPSYKPMWQYDVTTLAKDLSAHVAYGAGTASAFRALLGK